MGKESACNAGDLGLIPGLGRSSGEGNGNPFQYFCLENPMDRGAWQSAVHAVTRVRHYLASKPPTTASAGQSFDPWVRKISWSKKCQPTPVFLPGMRRGARGYSPWGRKESDTTEHGVTCSEFVAPVKVPSRNVRLMS